MQIYDQHIYARFNTCNKYEGFVFPSSFIAALVFESLSWKILIYRQKRQRTLLKSRLLFNKLANFTGKLLENYK